MGTPVVRSKNSGELESDSVHTKLKGKTATGTIEHEFTNHKDVNGDRMGPDIEPV